MIEEGIQKYYKPRDWIDKIYFYDTLDNPNSIRFIQNYVHKHHSTIHEFGWVHICQSKKIDLIKLIDMYFDDLTGYNISVLCKNIHAVYIIEKKLDKLLPEHWNSLCENCNAVHIIENNLDKISSYGWGNMCKNCNAIHILEKNIDKINSKEKWENICENPNAYDIIINNKQNIQLNTIIQNKNPKIFNLCFDKDCLDIYYQYTNYFIQNLWRKNHKLRLYKGVDLCIIKFQERHYLNSNVNSIQFIKENPDYLYLEKVCAASLYEPKFLELIEHYKHKLDDKCYYYLFKNKNAVHLYKHKLQDVSKLTTYELNILVSNPIAFEIIKNKLDLNKITPDGCVRLCKNPNAIQFIKDNLDFINSKLKLLQHNNIWKVLSHNPNIYTYKYNKMKHKKQRLHNEFKRKYYMLDIQTKINKYNCNIILDYL